MTLHTCPGHVQYLYGQQENRNPGALRIHPRPLVTKTDLAEFKAEINETLAEHTSDLNIIKNDLKTNLDKRLTLEVRVTNIEKKKVFGASQEPAHQ